MNLRTISVSLALAVVSLGLVRPASAQWVVLDPAALTQLLIQVEQIEQEIALAQQTVSQSKQAYSSMTGSRGMQSLLGGVNRNYLPMSWAQLNGAMVGGGGAYAGLASDVSSTVSRNAVLSSAQLASLSTDAQDSVTQRRQSIALSEGLSREALTVSSDRFASIQTLIGAIPSASDQKAILELNARISAELGMLQNEQIKLVTLYQAAQVAAQTEALRSDEKAIVGIGRLRDLPPMGLPIGTR